MLAFIEVTVNVFVFVVLAIVSFAFGYSFRLGKQNKIKKNLERMEQDMLANHAEILRLQKELAEKTPQESQTPIVPIRDNSNNDKNPGENPLRKKMAPGKP